MQTKSRTIAATLAVSAIALAASQAAAQSATPSHEELAARISALESERSGPLRIGPNTTLDIYGFVQVDFIRDFDADQGDFTNASAAGTNNNGEFDTSVRVSRIGFRTNTTTDFGNIGTQLEFDLIGNGAADFSAEPRIRHANVTIGDRWLVGQFWSNFMPIGQYPTTVDFNGPVGITFLRAPQVRYTGTTGALTYSASIEENNSNSEDPRLTAALSYGTDLFTVRGAVLAGTVREAVGGVQENQNAFTLSGNIRPFEGGSFTATYTSGQGIGSFLIGGGADFVAGRVNEVDAFTVEYRQDIGDKLNVGVAFGREDYGLVSNAGLVNEFKELESIHVNAFYRPVENFAIGLEYSQVTRINAADAEFDADRVGVNVRYSF